MPARKWCFVPNCTNTSSKTPQKIFVTVPITSKRREKWFAAARRDIKAVSPTSALYCCEDHFDIENDMDNYIEYKMSKVRARMNPDVVPHKFKCEPDVHLIVKKKRKFSEKRARHKHIVEYLQSVAGPSTENFDLEETNVIQPSEEGNSLQHISTLKPQRILHDKSSQTKFIYFRCRAVEMTKKSEKTEVSLVPIKFLDPLKELTSEPPNKLLRMESVQANVNSPTVTETSDSEFCQHSQSSTKSSISDIDQLTVKTEQEHIRGYEYEKFKELFSKLKTACERTQRPSKSMRGRDGIYCSRTNLCLNCYNLENCSNAELPQISIHESEEMETDQCTITETVLNETFENTGESFSFVELDEEEV